MKNFFNSFTNEKGFTLVEMLAVLIIFIITGSVLLSILVTSLRTSHKTDVLTQVRENGNYVITQMAKTIRNARGLVTPFPCVTPVTTTTISILSEDQTEITYDCTPPPSPTPATIASNSATMLDTSAVSLTACSFTCTQVSKSELPVIQINFSLQQQSSSTFAEQKTTAVPFQTSIVMRNIIR